MKKFLSLLVGAAGVATFLPLLATAAVNDQYSPPASTNAECMQRAVTNRGSAMMDAFNVFHDAVGTALRSRVTAETKAWGEADSKAQNKALRESSQAFDKAYATASKELDRRKHATWQQFEKDVRNCKAKPTSDTGTSQTCKPNDIDGSRGAYFQCYNGTETKRFADACQSSESWQKIGEDFCKGHCNKESGKCGVNTFSALDACSKSCPTPEKKCVAYCPDGTAYNSCVQYFADPCMNHSSSSPSLPSITIITPNGGETYKHDGSPITVNWKTTNIPSNQKLDVVRLRSVSNGQEYNVAFGTLNDGQEVVSVSSSVPVGSYTLEIKAAVNGTTIMDASDSYFKLIDTTESVVSEQVTCYFDSGASATQTCYGFDEHNSSITYTCSGRGSCVADVKGPKGSLLTWKSSCGGYAYTTLDGTSEYAKFSCNANIK